MVVVHVHLTIKPDQMAAFEAATAANARGSRTEPGNLRFDAMKHASEPNHYILYEVFRDKEAQQAHRETPHYKTWKELTTPMVENRTVIEFEEVYIVDK